MKRFHLFTLGGIPVGLHGSLLFALVLLGIFVFISSEDPSHAWQTLGGALLTLGCVLIHEYGHAWAARRCGLQVADISIHAFYGMTRMEPPRTPREELTVGFAGPLANLLVAAVLAPLALGSEGFEGWIPRTFWSVAFVINLVLGGLNLVPAFPMDGGRLLRALLSMKLDHSAATRIAVVVGRALAIVACLAPIALGFVGWSLALPLIGVIVLFLGEAEWHRVRIGLEGRRVSGWLQTGLAVAPGHQSSPTDHGLGDVDAPDPGGPSDGISDTGS